MSYYLNLYVSHNVYNEITEAIMDATKTKDCYYEISDLVHLLDHLEELYEEDSAKRNKEFQKYQEYQELFEEKKPYHAEYFNKIKKVLDENEENGSFKWTFDKEAERDEFHMICEIIDAFMETKCCCDKGDEKCNSKK